MSRDTWLIVMACAMRAFGQGTVFVLIAIYLHLVEFNLVQIGLFLSAALAGAAVYTLSIMFVCDTLGRRRLLIAFAIILAGASAMVASMEQFPVLIAVAFLGAFSVAGGGAAGAMQPLEQSSLSETVAEGQRTDLYAIYGIMGTGGTALGALAAAAALPPADFHPVRPVQRGPFRRGAGGPEPGVPLVLHQVRDQAGVHRPHILRL